MAFLGHFETAMIQKTNYDTAQQQQTNQWVLTSVQFNLVIT